jgi:D-cysteine desulfhydrase
MKTPVKLNIGNIPTPIQQLNFDKVKFLIKRDDYTGSEFSGNKIRKLEYLLAEAKKIKADYIFTCGGDQSNHARATVAASLMFGFKPVLFLWGREQKIPEGNLFLNKFYGADIKYLTRQEYSQANEIMFSEKKKFESRGKKVYVIPEGGSSTLGIWGYINFIKELREQINTKSIRKIYAASGSGGTAAGLLAGVCLNKLDIKICAVNVLYPKNEIRAKILNLAEGCNLDYNLDIEVNPERLEILEGYSKEGYKNIEQSKIDLIKRFARETGIIFDPVYTGKAFNAFYDKAIKKNESGSLFIHTGGLFGVFSKRKEYLNIKEF